MPIYEFRCRKCKKTFDIFFRNRDEKLTVVCPKCGSARAERQMSTFAGKIGNASAGGASCGGCTATSCGPSCRH